ncbi:MAG: hypothetical protein U0793_30035 [Gemmataceae bacterium]
MSEPSAEVGNGRAAEETAPLLQLWHYQAWCGVCLGLIFLAQFTQGIVLTNLVTVLLGVVGILLRVRWGVFFLLSGVIIAQSMNFFLNERYMTWGGRGREPELHDFLLGIGVLGYVMGQYRLQGLWHFVWPADPRQRAGPVGRRFLFWRGRAPIVQHRRAETDLRMPELVNLAFLIPTLALAAMVLFTVTRPARDWLELPGGLAHFVVLLWILLLGGWVVRQALELWHAWSPGDDEATLFLQDQVWKDLRGEQRRIERWRAWAKAEGRGKKAD